MKIFITGINGFLGSHLALHLHQKGHEISGSSRGPHPLDQLKAAVKNYYPHQLLESADGFFKDLDLVIHGAYSSSKKEIVKTNVEGTRQLYFDAVKAGVKHHIFISSYSAKEDSPSNYSIIKYRLDEFFRSNKHSLVKPGLVLGNGGLFKNIFSSITKLPLVPLAGGGKFKIPVVTIDSFLEAMVQIVNDTTPKTYHLFNDRRVTLKELAREIRNQTASTTLLFPLPFSPVLWLSILIEKLKIPFPFTSDSLIGLKQFESIPLESHLSLLKIKEESLDAIVKNLIKITDN